LTAAGVHLKIVAPGVAKWIKKYKEETKFQGATYSDDVRAVYQALQVKYAASYSDLLQGSSDYMGSKLSGALYSAKIAIKEGSESGDVKQLGAVFVLQDGGKCLHHYFESSPADHPVIEAVWRKAGAAIPVTEVEGKPLKKSEEDDDA